MTPEDYEPPGFKAASSDNFHFEEEPMNIKVGDVTTVTAHRHMLTLAQLICKMPNKIKTIDGKEEKTAVVTKVFYLNNRIFVNNQKLKSI